MELFSKRYCIFLQRLGRLPVREGEDKRKLLPTALRNRLQHEVKYVIHSNYLEQFLLVKDSEGNELYLHASTLSDLSFRELGYDMTEILDCKEMDFNGPHYDDARFFDLIELLIIFSIRSKIDELVDRFQTIFREEGDSYIIHKYMIFRKNETGLRSILPLVKDRQLKNKLEEYYDASGLHFRDVKTNYEADARTAADLVQMIFSSPSRKKDTKAYAEDLCKQVASKWTDEKSVKKLTDLLNETVKNAKLLSNEVGNIRHTDKHTVPVENPNFYRLIARKNISIVELVILSLPEKFVTNQNAETIKNGYLSRYGLDKDVGWVIANEERVGIEDEIPF